MNTADLIARIKKQPIGFACVVICLLSGGWIYYRGAEITAREEANVKKSAEAAVIISNVSVSKNLPEQVAEIQAFTKELEGRLVRASQLAVNLQYFYKLEAENEVKLVSVSQNSLPKSTKPTLYVGIPYSVNVQGSYKQIMAFVQRLENGRHFCRVNSAVFSKGGGATSEGPGPVVTGLTLSINLELLGQP